MTYYIKDALKKQFDLLSQASGACVDGDELSTLTHAMLQVCEFLERIERDEAARHSSDECSRTSQMDSHAADGKIPAALRSGMHEHGVPEAITVDDGEELRSVRPTDFNGKAIEHVIRLLKEKARQRISSGGSVIRRFCATLRMRSELRSWQTRPHR